jgi:FkbM family methyltransferase
MYHSQVGQDKLVSEIYRGKRNGYFVDVGAYDGITISNTFHFEKELGWTGICVEPLPNVFPKLVLNRSCICVNSCVSTTEGSVFFKCRGKGSRIVQTPGRNTVERKSETLAAILDRSKAPKNMEYLSIDIEGLEFDVLKSFPFHQYGFGVITVEHNAYVGIECQERREQMLTFLSAKGYVREMEVQQDDLYINPPVLKSLMQESP